MNEAETLRATTSCVSCISRSPTTRMLPKYIPNRELVAEKLPAPDADWDVIKRFALTFDGYKRWGSNEACAEVANNKRHNSMTELRTCLFYEQRRWRNFGYAPDEAAMRYIREVLEQIRERTRLANELLA